MKPLAQDLRAKPQNLGGSTFDSPLSYDGVTLQGYQVVATILWFSRTAVQADAEKDFEGLEL